MNLIEKVKAHKTLDLLAKANEITIKEHGNRITLKGQYSSPGGVIRGLCLLLHVLPETQDH